MRGKKDRFPLSFPDSLIFSMAYQAKLRGETYLVEPQERTYIHMYVRYVFRTRVKCGLN